MWSKSWEKYWIFLKNIQSFCFKWCYIEKWRIECSWIYLKKAVTFWTGTGCVRSLTAKTYLSKLLVWWEERENNFPVISGSVGRLWCLQKAVSIQRFITEKSSFSKFWTKLKLKINLNNTLFLKSTCYWFKLYFKIDWWDKKGSVL